MPRPVSPLVCPICAAPLAGEGDRRGDFAVLRCPAGHTFDVAREGYVNLAAGRPPKHPGDTREQVEARRAFTGAGHYKPIAGLVAGLVQKHVSSTDSDTRTALDVGCGEGYFTVSLDVALRAESWVVFGLDVSKDAIRLAAGRCPNQRYVVADANAGLPFGSDSIDLLLNIFAPRPAAEMIRVLRPGGTLLIVIPRPDHLLDLRDSYHLLGIEEDKADSITGQFRAFGFGVAAEESLTCTLHLDSESVVNLLMMTPNYHHLRPEQIAAARAVRAMEAVASVSALVLRRGP